MRAYIVLSLPFLLLPAICACANAEDDHAQFTADVLQALSEARRTFSRASQVLGRAILETKSEARVHDQDSPLQARSSRAWNIAMPLLRHGLDLQLLSPTSFDEREEGHTTFPNTAADKENESNTATCGLLRELAALRRSFVTGDRTVLTEKAQPVLKRVLLSVARDNGVRDERMQRLERGWKLLAPLVLSAFGTDNAGMESPHATQLLLAAIQVSLSALLDDPLSSFLKGFLKDTKHSDLVVKQLLQAVLGSLPDFPDPALGQQTTLDRLGVLLGRGLTLLGCD